MMRKYITLIIFGIAFAFVEAAVVIYLRNLFGFNLENIHDDTPVILNLGLIALISNKFQVFPDKNIYHIEFAREAATLIMLACISYVASSKKRKRLAAFLITFSVWDIFYYLFLRLLSGWPDSLFSIDVFFLIPLPWVGPVFIAVTASIIMFYLGTKMFLYKKGK